MGLNIHDTADHDFFSNRDIKINKTSAEDQKLPRRDTNIKLKETTVSMPEDSHNNHNKEHNPYKQNKNMWTPPPQRQRKTESISESRGVAALHSTVEYPERHVLTGHRESEMHSELAGSGLIWSVPHARL